MGAHNRFSTLYLSDSDNDSEENIIEIEKPNQKLDEVNLPSTEEVMPEKEDLEGWTTVKKEVKVRKPKKKNNYKKFKKNWKDKIETSVKENLVETTTEENPVESTVNENIVE